MTAALVLRVHDLEAGQFRHTTRLERIDGALDVTGVKLDDASAHAREFRSETAERLDRIEGRLDGIEGRLDGVEAVQADHTATLAEHGERLNRIEEKLDRLTGLVEQLLQR